MTPNKTSSLTVDQEEFIKNWRSLNPKTWHAMDYMRLAFEHANTALYLEKGAKELGDHAHEIAEQKLQSEISQLKEQLGVANAERKDARNVIKFYGTKENWMTMELSDLDDWNDYEQLDKSSACVTGGKRAREFLRQYPEVTEDGGAE